jgi:phospholipid/cholesterol/gamma-HCH transport system substrate-binding protein
MRNPFRGMLNKSFLERNQRITGLIGVLAVLAGTAFALLLSGGVFARRYTVTAFFTDAAGIQSGDDVTVAGLGAGAVKGLRIEQGKVAIDLAVDSGVKLPSDSRAEIVVQTLLGKEAVNLVAGRASSELRDGSVIPVDRTTTPVDITELNDISVRLMEESDAGALNDFLAEVSNVTAGKDQEVHELIGSLANVVEAVDSRRQQLSRLITSLRILSTTFGERDKTIVSMIDNLNPVLANLAARQRDIQTLLEATDAASHNTADLVVRNRAVLDQTLSALHDDLSVLNAHQLDIAATITYLNQSVQGYQSVGYSEGNCGEKDPPCNEGIPNHWANIFVQSLGPAGIDALLGKCGAVDQLIDEMLGSNCEDSGGSGGGQGRVPLPGSGGQNGGGRVPIPGVSPLPNPRLPVPTPSLPRLPRHRGLAATDEAFPGTIEDLINSWIAGTQGGQNR